MSKNETGQLKLTDVHKAYLIEFFTSFVAGKLLTEEALRYIISRFYVYEYKNGEHFSSQGEVCNTMGILYQGLFKIINKNTKGEMLFCDFNFANYNTIVGDLDSFNSRKPSSVNVFSKRNSVVLCIDQKDMTELCNLFPDFNCISKCMICQSDNARENLLIDYKYLKKARQKRDRFAQQFPHCFLLITCEELAVFFGYAPNIYYKKHNH